MVFLYNLIIKGYELAIRSAAALGNQKAKKFVHGRSDLFIKISTDLENESRQRVWIHASSLGEFEQARPLIESIKYHYPQYAIILTFFSPSGYEIRKDYKLADYIYYLPIDSAQNAYRFLHFVHPRFSLFTKYDYWYHYLTELKNRQIPTILFSAVFQLRQPFFKWYGYLHRQMLQSFKHIFVQDATSIGLLTGINIDNTSVAGDTRIDRVITIAAEPFKDSIIEHFKDNQKVFIIGSAWESDWELVLESISTFDKPYKLIIAPHEIDEETIQALIKSISSKKLTHQTYTAYQKALQVDVLIVNTIGILSYIYRYADFAWVGGGFEKSGIHNILEPAAYNLPIAIGPNYTKFNEAITLVHNKGIASISTPQALTKIINTEPLLNDMKVTTQHYILEHAGAVKKIMKFIEKHGCLSDN